MTTHAKIASLAVLGAVACSGAAQQTKEQPEAAPEQPVHVKVLAFSDLHGYLEGPSGSVEVQGTKLEAGGADRLAAKVAEIRAVHPLTAVVTAGDMIGASPLLSALFHDEPTIESLNAMQLDVAGVGNHEFDEGVDELKRMQTGGCHPTDGCQDGDDFGGAEFPLLAANVTVESSGETIFPGYWVKDFGKVKVGFIGLTLEDTPSVVSPEGVKGLKFGDEADTINAVVPELQKQGVEAIVVLIHEGGRLGGPSNDVNDCPDVSGPIVEIVQRTDKAVDAFVTGHTHQAYICEFDGRIVTAAKSYGRLLTEIDLHIDPKTGDVVERKAQNLVVDRNGEPAPAVQKLIAKYGAIAAPLANEKVGVVSATISREADANGISPLGRLIADIQLAATKGEVRGNAQVAFMNPGGIRASIELEPSADEGRGVLTYAEAHSVQPFGNGLVTMTLTGKQLHELLEAQWQDEGRVKILQPSKGFTYTWKEGAERGAKVDPASIKLGGKVVAPDAEYRVTVNSFLADGGDGFSVLADGTDRVGGPVDLEALVVWFKANSPVKPAKDRRAKRVE